MQTFTQNYKIIKYPDNNTPVLNGQPLYITVTQSDSTGHAFATIGATITARVKSGVDVSYDTAKVSVSNGRLYFKIPYTQSAKGSYFRRVVITITVHSYDTDGNEVYGSAQVTFNANFGRVPQSASNFNYYPFSFYWSNMQFYFSDDFNINYYQQRRVDYWATLETIDNNRFCFELPTVESGQRWQVLNNWHIDVHQALREVQIDDLALSFRELSTPESYPTQIRMLKVYVYGARQTEIIDLSAVMAQLNQIGLYGYIAFYWKCTILGTHQWVHGASIPDMGEVGSQDCSVYEMDDEIDVQFNGFPEFVMFVSPFKINESKTMFTYNRQEPRVRYDTYQNSISISRETENDAEFTAGVGVNSVFRRVCPDVTFKWLDESAYIWSLPFYIESDKEDINDSDFVFTPTDYEKTGQVVNGLITLNKADKSTITIVSEWLTPDELKACRHISQSPHYAIEYTRNYGRYAFFDDYNSNGKGCMFADVSSIEYEWQGERGRIKVTFKRQQEISFSNVIFNQL